MNLWTQLQVVDSSIYLVVSHSSYIYGLHFILTSGIRLYWSGFHSFVWKFLCFVLASFIPPMLIFALSLIMQNFDHYLWKELQQNITCLSTVLWHNYKSALSWHYLCASPLFWRYSWILSSSSTGNWAMLFYTKTKEGGRREQVCKNCLNENRMYILSHITVR